MSFFLISLVTCHKEQALARDRTAYREPYQKYLNRLKFDKRKMSSFNNNNISILVNTGEYEKAIRWFLAFHALELQKFFF